MLLIIQLYNLQLNQQDVLISTLDKISKSYYNNSSIAFNMKIVYTGGKDGDETDSLRIETRISKNVKFITLPGIKLIRENGLNLEISEDEKIMFLEKSNKDFLPDQEIFNKLKVYLTNKIFIGQIVKVSDNKKKILITDETKEFVVLEIIYDKNNFLPYEVYQQDLIIADDFEPQIQSLKINYSNYKFLKVEEWQSSWTIDHFIMKNGIQYQPTEKYKSFTLNVIN